jgi:hypothetical protein
MNLLPTWTDERVTELRRLWPDFSAAQCALRLGVSRGAIIGKIHRLNGYRPMPKHKKVEAIQVKPIKRRPEPEPEAVITDLAPDTSVFAVPIQNLRSSMCRYPLGMPSADMLYCGAASHGPWCPRHRRIVYTRPGVRG